MGGFFRDALSNSDESEEGEETQETEYDDVDEVKDEETEGETEQSTSAELLASVRLTETAQINARRRPTINQSFRGTNSLQKVVAVTAAQRTSSIEIVVTGSQIVHAEKAPTAKRQHTCLHYNM